ncbi:VanW family protein [Candidatus Microgenomates bacterium]|nr:VanW family protein [Candidatus Microgenomates bacterium]
MKKNWQKILTIAGFIVFFLFFTITTALALYDRQFANKVYPGIKVDNVDLSAKTKEEVEALFINRNNAFAPYIFTFRYREKTATVSAKTIGLGINSKLIADQAFTIGRSGNMLADLFNKGKAFFGELTLATSYSLNRLELERALLDITKEANVLPVEAVFKLEGKRVVDFRPSSDGATIDIAQTEEEIFNRVPDILESKTVMFEITLPVKKIKPQVSLSEANNLGIKELIGKGTSNFSGSITNRIHNIVLAASRINGTIVLNGQVFSFNNAVGDVSKLTGYKEAYIIKDGKTILGDGGGVCQVSTTLFRSILQSGLPIVERHPHSYRVAYYEQSSPPGLDATVYSPSYDLKFKNDTGYAILIQAYADLSTATLTFDLYGTSDGRSATITKPVVANQTPPPEDRYQDDPTLPLGTIKQIDFKAAGARVTFSRTVEKDGKIIISDTFVSNYQPWQAVYLRGTKE